MNRPGSGCSISFCSLHLLMYPPTNPLRPTTDLCTYTCSWVNTDSPFLFLQPQDGAHVDEWGHLQDGLLLAQRRTSAVLSLWSTTGHGGPGHPGAGLCLCSPPPEASSPCSAPCQCQGSLRTLGRTRTCDRPAVGAESQSMLLHQGDWPCGLHRRVRCRQRLT